MPSAIGTSICMAQHGPPACVRNLGVSVAKGNVSRCMYTDFMDYVY